MSTNTTSPNEPTRNGNLLVNQQDAVAVARVADNDKEFISSRTTFVVQESPPELLHQQTIHPSAGPSVWDWCVTFPLCMMQRCFWRR